MREAAGADDCWTHDVIGDWKEIVAGNIKCDCPKKIYTKRNFNPSVLLTSRDSQFIPFSAV